MTNNWMEQNQELFHALGEEQAVTFIVIGLIVCVAALNILIALTMMVMEKTRDIAVLMSYGVRPSQVRRIFVWQGMLIGILGTSIGLVLGYALAWVGGHYRIIHLSAAVYSLDYLPFAPRWQDGVIVAAGGAWGFAAGDALSFVIGGKNSSGRSAAVRVTPEISVEIRSRDILHLFAEKTMSPEIVVAGPEDWPELPLAAWQDTYNDAAYVVAGCRQSSPGTEPEAESLVGSPALRQRSRAHHFADSLRARNL